MKCELLSNAQMSSFSLLALSAPGCCHLHRKQFKHDHTSARQPQLRRLADLCKSRQAWGHAFDKATKCSAGQVQSTFSCCSSPWSHSKFLQHSHPKAFRRMVLPVLQGHGDAHQQSWQDGALPAQLPAQNFLCQFDAEEVDRAAHAAAAQAHEPHSQAPLVRRAFASSASLA